ncbi:MAG: protein-disulfide reductase DsbD [Alteromonadaceae bacterium]|nr:protein-disulfide reductase DsbD [Alteromonadaceae bacterium]
MKLKVVVWLVLSFFVSSLFARQFDTTANDLFSDEPEFLTVDDAFLFDFRQQNDELVLTWQIAEGYYLYKKQFKTALKGAVLGEPQYPEAVQIEDEFFGISDVYFDSVELTYAIDSAKQDARVKIRYQGCAEAGLCYPPTTKVVYLSAVGDVATSSIAASDSTETMVDTPVSEQHELLALLQSDQHFALTLLIFVGIGIGLAFTPCVFPMYPIISSIVVGQGKQAKTSRVLSLSFFYVQGMAITYSLLGLVVASAGVQFQAMLQHPGILGTLIVIFVALALVMFGAYELQLPSKWQCKLNEISQKQKGGAYGSVFVMGAISGLVASPCTTAPLTAILLLIAQTGDLLFGFTTLYALSIGMGIPLVIFAVTGGKLLPKAGNWMNTVKITFGFMMLVVALVFVERLIENMWTNLAWAALGLTMFSYFYVVNGDTKATFAKGVRSLIIFVGLFSSLMYGYNQLFPAKTVTGQVAYQAHPEFTIVKDLADFEKKLAAANAQGKTVMIDLYADWCVACKEFEKYTFTDYNVQQALANTEWMQIDLTDNTPQSLEFQEFFAVLGLPTIMFFDTSGNELEKARVTGFLNAERFAQHVNQHLK